MEYFKKNFSDPTRMSNNANSTNDNLLYSGLKNYNTNSSKITKTGFPSMTKLT